MSEENPYNLRDYYVGRVDNDTVCGYCYIGDWDDFPEGCSFKCIRYHWYINTVERTDYVHWAGPTDVSNYGEGGVFTSNFNVPEFATSVRCHMAVIYTYTEDGKEYEGNFTPLFVNYDGNPRTKEPATIDNLCTVTIDDNTPNGVRTTWTCGNDNVSKFEVVHQGSYNGTWSTVNSTTVEYQQNWEVTATADKAYTRIRSIVRPIPTNGQYRCEWAFSNGEHGSRTPQSDGIPNPAYTAEEQQKMIAPQVTGVKCEVKANDPYPTVSWTTNKTEDTRFEVYRREATGSYPKTPLHRRTASAGVSSYSWHDTGVAVGKLYVYEVKGVNTYNNCNHASWGVAEGGYGYKGSANEVGPGYTIPAVPKGPNANLHTSDPESGTAVVRLDWTQSGAELTYDGGFDLQWADDKLKFNGNPNSGTALAAARQFLTDTVEANKMWYFRMRAKNTAGDSAWTAIKQYLPRVRPRTPTCSAELLANRNVKVTISSSDTAAKKIKVYRRTPSTKWGCIATLAATPNRDIYYEDKGTAPGGKYLYCASATLEDEKVESSLSVADAVGGWVEREPAAPTELEAFASAVESGQSGAVTLTWKNSGLTGTGFTVRYTSKSNLDPAYDTGSDIQEATFGPPQVPEDGTSCTIGGLSTAETWRFSLCRTNSVGSSGWAAAREGGHIVTAVVATKPEPPTLMVDGYSYVIGDIVSLEWRHNNEDKSAQEDAQVQAKSAPTVEGLEGAEWRTVGFNLGERDYLDYDPSTWYTEAQPTGNENPAELGWYELDAGNYVQTEDTTVEQGKQYYVRHGVASGDYVMWRVRTAGLGQDNWSDWSEGRTFRMWAPANPSMALMGPDGTQLEGNMLEQLPLRVNLAAQEDATGENGVIEWWCEIISIGGYETTAPDGTAISVADGEVVWSGTMKSGSTDWMDGYESAHQFVVGASDMRFSGTYTVRGGCLTEQGLASNAQDAWLICVMSGEVGSPEMEAQVVRSDCSCAIIPACYTDDGEGGRELDANVTLAVYRVDQDGETSMIATGLPNDGTAQCVDPYPNFGSSVYRVVATSSTTGAQAVAEEGVTVPSPGTLIQWGDNSLLLPFTLDWTESYDPDVALFAFEGRKDQVSVYGTQLGRTASCKTKIHKRVHKDELMALRRLAVAQQDCYVREVTGSGFPASVKVSGLSWNAETVEVTAQLEMTRVEA